MESALWVIVALLGFISFQLDGIANKIANNGRHLEAVRDKLGSLMAPADKTRSDDWEQ